MLFLNIILITLAVLAGLVILAFFIQPGLLTLPYSKIISLFVKNPPYLDKDVYFPESKILEENWEVIREELGVILQNNENVPKFHEIDSIQRFISAKDEIPWRTFVLKAYGKWVDNNCEMAPKTVEMLQGMPKVITALFSILDGGKHIPPHIGFFKGVLRYHLGLVVPQDAPCYILVDGQKYSWKEGEGVVLDDTFVHEVWNKSSERRVVLFIDVLRDTGVPPWIARLNYSMYQMLGKSKRLEKAIKRAEVPKDLGQKKKVAA
jgi:beta-hydroxylase